MMGMKAVEPKLSNHPVKTRVKRAFSLPAYSDGNGPAIPIEMAHLFRR